MHMKLTKEEKLIEFFINKYKNSKSNEISINKSDVSNLNLTEQEAARVVYLLQEENKLVIKQKSIHDDFRIFWTIILKSSCIHYFDNKKETKKHNQKEKIKELRSWITLLIAIMAFVLSVYSIYLQYFL